MNNQIIISEKPKHLIVCLTTKCNLTCIMCGDSLAGTKWELPSKCIKEIVEILPFLKTVGWRGGEVFLYKHFEELFDKTSNIRNLQQSINTNGLLIDEKWAEKLVRNNVFLILSVDGLNRNTYEYIRQGGSFERLISNLEMIKYKRQGYLNESSAGMHPASFDICMNFVVMRSNYKDLQQIVKFAKTYEIKTVRLSKLVIPEMNTALQSKLKNELIDTDDRTRKIFNDLVNDLKIDADKNDVKIENWLGLEEENLNGDIDFAKNGNTYCKAPWEWLYIEIGGDVYFHCFCNTPIGHIDEDALGNIWNNKKAQDFRKYVIYNNGNKCKSRDFLRCNALIKNEGDM